MASETLKTPEVKEKKAQGERDRKKKNGIPVPICSNFTWILLAILIHFLKSYVLLKQNYNGFL